MKTDLVKGFRDYTGKEAQKRAEIKKIIVETFEKYGFEPAETPIIENEEFVKGDNTQDEAVSDIFKLQDKGKRKLALRYEVTFPLKRIMKNQKLPYKTYRIGNVFRDEPVSANRFRQFTQCDADVIGSSLKDEAEVLALTYEVMKKLGIKNKIMINNRKLLNEILDERNIKNKEQVLREIDKLDKISENEVKKNLKKYKAGWILEVIKKPESYFKKYSSYSKIEELKKYCKLYGIEVVFKPSLVRGLSYYNGTIFETQAIAGGSYLVNGIQSTGISFGLERVCMLTKFKADKEKYLIVSLGQDKEAVKIAQKLRKKGKPVSIFYGKPSKALAYANSCDYNKVIFVGEKEVRAKRFKVKDMVTGREKVLVLEKRKKGNLVMSRRG